MSSKRKIEAAPVALTELKAEISRRQLDIENHRFKLETGSSAICKSKLKFKRNEVSRFEARPSSKISKISNQDTNEFELEKSRKTLEAKAKLYEALKEASESGKLKFKENEADNGESLIDFERKAYENSDKSERSRTTTDTKDFDYQPNTDSSDDESKIAYEQLKKDYQKEIDHVTYSHLRQGEIRTHGVGFYAFSTDLEEREKEQARLEELHRQTEAARIKNLKMKSQRDADMGRRLAKLRARKGLPDVTVIAEEYLKESNTSDEQVVNDEIDIASMLRKMRDESDARAKAKEALETENIQANNPTKVVKNTLLPLPVASREWDAGKR